MIVIMVMVMMMLIVVMIVIMVVMVVMMVMMVVVMVMMVVVMVMIVVMMIMMMMLTVMLALRLNSAPPTLSPSISSPPGPPSSHSLTKHLIAARTTYLGTAMAGDQFATGHEQVAPIDHRFVGETVVAKAPLG